ncbi:uncharacterized protein LOC143024077, partial [Oratosquilla oratoria]|uniref:uncharacterized protein LOC143024077 n=1 Tax=Oratosquilla oratoria TaxID=337810 RepID=UPI003F76EDEC
SSTATVGYSAYKPVPPPKPFTYSTYSTSSSATSSTINTTIAATAASSSSSSSSSASSSSGAASESTAHASKSVGATADDVRTGSTLYSSNGPPPLLNHILVTDQGHFHTHSTKFPIEVKEGPSSLPTIAPSIPTTSHFVSRASTLGRCVSGPSSSFSSMVAPRTVGTLPRMNTSRHGDTALTDVRQSLVMGHGGSGLSSARGFDPNNFSQSHQANNNNNNNSHINKNINNNKGEDRTRLLLNEKPRFGDGIDNPGLIDDNYMPSFRAAGGSGIPPEGTLAGVLPQRPFESPYLQRHGFRQQQQQQQQQQPPPPQQQQLGLPNGQQQQQQPSTQNGVNSHSGGGNLTRESWARTSQGQYTGVVEVQTSHAHQYTHVNGHHAQHYTPTSHAHHQNGSVSNGHITMNGAQQQLPHVPHMNGGSERVNGHDGPHVHTNGHHHHHHQQQHQQQQQPPQPQGILQQHSPHHSHHHPQQQQQQQHQHHVMFQLDDDDEDKNNNDKNEKNEQQKKDDKKGSLTKGLASKKYLHFRDMLSSKFSKDKSEEKGLQNGAFDGRGGVQSQGISTQQQQLQEVGDQGGPNGRDSGRFAKLNSSFRRAIHHNSQKTNLQHQNSPAETSFSVAQSQHSPQQQKQHQQYQGSAVHGLPPQYPRSPSQYRQGQPPPLSPPSYRGGPSGGSAQPLTTSQSTSHLAANEPLGRGLANQRSGSYHHLAQTRQEHSNWRPHHFSVENLSETQALPSDHTYSGPAVVGGRNQSAGVEGGGGGGGSGGGGGTNSGGSDSGRGTAGSGEGRNANTLDTSIESAASNRQNGQGHSSGNDSEWIDLTDAELHRILKKEKKANAKSSGGGATTTTSSSGRKHDPVPPPIATTPPLPPLSPEGSPGHSPNTSPTRHRKYNASYGGGVNKPDLLEAAGREGGGGGGGGGGHGGHGNSTQPSSSPRRHAQSHLQKGYESKSSRSKSASAVAASSQQQQQQQQRPQPSHWGQKLQEEKQQRNLEAHSKTKNRLNLEPLLTLGPGGDLDAGEVTSTTDALDLDSMLDGATEATSDDDVTSVGGGRDDVHLIRKQLEGLEMMYSEVIKLLGGSGSRKGLVVKTGGGGGGGELKSSRRRLHGSMSSLPSSIVSSRPGRDKRRVLDDRVRRGGVKDGSKTINKRFQRLESHVVTLARSVAHLSSEMRTQHMMFQEIENVRAEVAALRAGGPGGGAPARSPGHCPGGGPSSSWEAFRAGIPSLSNPGRVKKLKQFFGDEPPLVRIFLKKLGYEKYAGLFEQEKIGMLELPYLTEERLQKIGVPMGPRLRILQEAQGPIRREGNLSVYVV